MNFISKVISKIRIFAQPFINGFKKKSYLANLRKTISVPNTNYDHYLDEQLKRTILKNSNELLPRTKLLVRLIIEKGNPAPDSKILCVGCRNTAELDYFQSNGLQNTTGIDLLSENPRIMIMDMHKLTFEDNSFDIVYSSHSLEHSFNIEQVVQEFVRVARNSAIIAIEIPVRYQTTEADRHDLKNVEGIMSLFSSFTPKLLWSEDLETRAPGNTEGTPIVRVIFRITK